MSGCLVLIGVILFGLFVVAMWVLTAYLVFMAIAVIIFVLASMAVAYFGGMLVAWLIERFFMGKNISYGDIISGNIGDDIGVWVIIITVIVCLGVLIYCI